MIICLVEIALATFNVFTFSATDQFMPCKGFLN